MFPPEVAVVEVIAVGVVVLTVGMVTRVVNCKSLP
jgi:hypothetical protein